MKTKPRLWLMAAAAALAAVSFSSCVYDPYYTDSYGSASYTSVGYGYGHGYGGSSFSTSLFVSTGDPRWGYDPYCGSYYDYNRRAYYDPYLYGYYPVGYRPPLIVGAPHPHGWRPGRNYCPPPRRVTNVTLVNYRQREDHYRKLNQPWSKNVRVEGNRGSVQRPQPSVPNRNDGRSPANNPQGNSWQRDSGNRNSRTPAIQQRPNTNRNAGTNRNTFIDNRNSIGATRSNPRQAVTPVPQPNRNQTVRPQTRPAPSTPSAPRQAPPSQVQPRQNSRPAAERPAPPPQRSQGRSQESGKRQGR